jgi:Protein of unknown function (DUF1698)
MGDRDTASRTCVVSALSRLQRKLVDSIGNLTPAWAHHSSFLDEYVTTAPSPQNAVNIFAGTWSSALPEPLHEVTAGPTPLFDDERVAWAVERLGGVSGRSVLELGPLEGGHTYQLLRDGASVTAIEAQTRAYLKCLIAKELLGMRDARFLLGDFMEYLRNEPEHVDICFASGVLYHMRNPVETIALFGDVADHLYLWTHVYDAEIIHAGRHRNRYRGSVPASYRGFEHTLHRFDYARSLSGKGFCGGGAAYSNWLSRADLLGALDRFGWEIGEIAFDTPEHLHGPALALVASKRR